MYKAIDVSHWQKPNIIETMKEAMGIKGVMIRAGHGLTVDEKMESFVRECERLELYYGFYWYYEGNSSSHWKKQTNLFLETIANYNPEMPIAIDYEESMTSTINQNCLMAGTMIEENNYFCVVYSNRNFMTNLWNQDVKDRFAIWLASWVNGEQTPADMWAYESMWDCNVVMVQYDTTAFGMSIDVNEFTEALPELCRKVRNMNYCPKKDALNIISNVMGNMKVNQPLTITINRSGDLYHVS